MENYRTFDPCNLLSPLPVVMVSCAEKEGATPNIITCAWAGTVNSDPPMVYVSVRRERYSHGLISASGEYVINLVDENLCKATDFCGVRSGRDVNKFEACSLRPMPAKEMVCTPAIAGAPAYLSCKVKQVIPLGSHDMFLAQVVGVEVRDDLFGENGSLRLDKAGLIAYNHGVYQRTADVLGFFGYSVAREDVLKRRMEQYK